MKTIKLQGETRQTGGSRAAGRLRREGKVPAVVYGHGQEPQSVAVEADEIASLLERHSQVIELSIGGKPSSVLIKDVQYDPMGIKVVHIDFIRVALDERVTVAVPLEFFGEAAGVKEGGLFEEHTVDVELEVTVTNIPSVIRVDISGLGLGDMLHAKNIEVPAGAKLVTPAEAMICTVRAKVTATEEEVAEGEEESAGPEIITAKQKEEGSGD